jgi:ABC-type uncharacterized transport system ATPase subunit
MRIAAGELHADAGTVSGEGAVALVHQHFLLVGELTVAENLALTSPRFRFSTRRSLERDAEETIARCGIAIGGVARRVNELSVGEKAKLELVKAISTEPAALVLDEPTSVLTPHETAELFAVMRRLAAGGTAVVLISHKLPEVLEVAERIVVMRAGAIATERRAADTTLGELAEAMVPGLESAAVSAPAAPSADRPPVFTHENLALHAGRITAIVGVAGNGQTALAALLRDRLRDEGHIPEDRTRDGIVADMTVAENLALRSRRFSPREAARHARQMIALYSIRAHGPAQRAGDLSGGNQQKVILARELDRRPRVIVAAEPARGLDVDATRFVHQQLRSAANAGGAILLITSDLDEAFALASTIQVINRGKLSDPMTPAQASTRIAALMAGAT